MKLSEAPINSWFTRKDLYGIWQKTEAISDSRFGDGCVCKSMDDQLITIKADLEVTVLAIDTKGDIEQSWAEIICTDRCLREEGAWGEDKELPRIDIPVFGQVEKAAVTTTDSSGVQEHYQIGYHAVVPDSQYVETLEQILVQLKSIQKRAIHKEYHRGSYSAEEGVEIWSRTTDIEDDILYLVTAIENAVKKGYYINTRPTE